MKMKNLMIGLIGAGVALTAAPAFAGEWRLQPERCGDIIEDHYDRHEDRRDARLDYGRYDRREDRWDRRENRRDEQIVVCPRSAFVYVPSRRELHAHGYFAPPRLTLVYDPRHRAYYRRYHGLNIYIRG